MDRLFTSSILLNTNRTELSSQSTLFSKKASLAQLKFSRDQSPTRQCSDRFSTNETHSWPCQDGRRQSSTTMTRMKSCHLMQNQDQTSDQSSLTASSTGLSILELPKVWTSFRRLFQAPVVPQPPQVPWLATSTPSTTQTVMAR